MARDLIYQSFHSYWWFCKSFSGLANVIQSGHKMWNLQELRINIISDIFLVSYFMVCLGITELIPAENSFAIKLDAAVNKHSD